MSFDPPPAGQQSLDTGLPIPAVHNADELAEKLADQMEGWSFAFLKELFISFLLARAAEHLDSDTLEDDDPVVDNMASSPYWKLIEHTAIVGQDALASLDHQSENKE